MSRSIRHPDGDEALLAELWLLRRRGDAAARHAREIIADLRERHRRLATSRDDEDA